MRRLQVLHDLVRVEHEVARQGHRRAYRERQGQYQRHQFPVRLVRGLRVDHRLQRLAWRTVETLPVEAARCEVFVVDDAGAAAGGANHEQSLPLGVAG